MTATDLTCPYCNARVPAIAGATKIPCPRCGELFSLPAGIQAAPGVTAAASASTAITAAPPEPLAPRPNPVRANRLVAGVILGVMALLAATSLAYALLTVQNRRSHDKELPPRNRRANLPPLRKLPALEPGEPVAPAQLPLLRYLPARTGVIAGLHAQELLGSAAGNNLRDRSIKIANFELRLDMVKDVVGLAAEDIDHIVLGVTIRDQAEPDATPPVHLLVRTRQPFDAIRLREKLEADKPRQEKTPSGGKRTVWPAKVRGLPMNLALLDDRTFALGLFTRLQDVPEKPGDNLDHLPAELRQVLGQRLATGMPLWIAGHAEDWTKTWMPALLGLFPDVPLAGQIDKVKTFAIGVIPDRPLKVQGVFHCPDEAAAKELEKEQLAPRAKKEEKTFTYTRDGAWLDVQWKVDLGK